MFSNLYLTSLLSPSKSLEDCLHRICRVFACNSFIGENNSKSTVALSFWNIESQHAKKLKLVKLQFCNHLADLEVYSISLMFADYAPSWREWTAIPKGIQHIYELLSLFSYL